MNDKAANDDTETVIAEIIGRLKHLIADHGFFCFLSDRAYYEAIDHKVTNGTYPTEHTYFSRRILITHRPDDLISYVEGLLDGEPADAFALRVFGLVIAYRSRMNFADVGRAVDAFITTDASLREVMRPGMQQQLTGLELRLAATIQLAINEVIATPPFDLYFRSDTDPRFMQMALDALYFLPRIWERDARAQARIDLARVKEEVLKRKCGCVDSARAHPGEEASQPVAGDENAAVDGEPPDVTAGPSPPAPSDSVDEDIISIPTDELRTIWKMVELQLEFLTNFDKLRDALIARVEALNQPAPGKEVSREDRDRAAILRDIVLTEAEIGTKGLIERKATKVSFLLDENCLPMKGGSGVEITLDEWLGNADHKAAIERLHGLLTSMNIDLAMLARFHLVRSALQAMNLVDVINAFRDANRARGRDERLRRAEESSRTLVEALQVGGDWLATSLITLKRLRGDLAELNIVRSNEELLEALVRHVPIPPDGAAGPVPPGFIEMTGQKAPLAPLQLDADMIEAFARALADLASPPLPREEAVG